MSTAGLPQFRKLWGKISEDLEAGEYQVTIVNNYDVSTFDGQKTVVVSTTSVFGGKNKFVGILYIFVGAVAVVGGFIMFAAFYLKRRNR